MVTVEPVSFVATTTWAGVEALPQADDSLPENHGYPAHRVLFDAPTECLQLDLAVLDDARRVVILGEAKKESKDLDRLLRGLQRHANVEPEPKRADESRQLAWRLWKARPDFLWLIGPSDRRAFKCSFGPLQLEPLTAIPGASDLDLATSPFEMLVPPELR
jgi:hypothetical protein